MKTFITLAIFLSSVVFVGTAKADVCDTPDNLLTNCGFEKGNLTGWLQSPAREAGNWYGVDTYDAHTGKYGAYLAGFGSYAAGDKQYALIGQYAATIVGKQYVLSYDWAHNNSVDPTAVPDDIFLAGINGFAVPGSVELNVGAQSFISHSYTFFATSASTLVAFQAEDANFYFSLDDVSLVAAPEPASLVFVAPAISGLWLLRRRRKARS